MSSKLIVQTVQGTAGNVDTPDQPKLSFGLLVHATTGRVSGHASIAWFGGHLEINDVTGRVHKLPGAEGRVRQFVVLKGTYGEKGPPPTAFVVERKFSAHFATDLQWNGYGDFEFGAQTL